METIKKYNWDVENEFLLKMYPPVKLPSTWGQSKVVKQKIIGDFTCEEIELREPLINVLKISKHKG